MEDMDKGGHWQGGLVAGGGDGGGVVIPGKFAFRILEIFIKGLIAAAGAGPEIYINYVC